MPSGSQSQSPKTGTSKARRSATANARVAWSEYPRPVTSTDGTLLQSPAPTRRPKTASFSTTRTQRGRTPKEEGRMAHSEPLQTVSAGMGAGPLAMQSQGRPDTVNWTRPATRPRVLGITPSVL